MGGDNVVFTHYYLWRRGYCFNSGCRHAPYDHGSATGITIVGAAAEAGDESG